MAEVKALLRADLLEQVGADMDRTLHAAPHGDRPAVLLVVGVNGTGKTTTCGKLARVLIGDGGTRTAGGRRHVPRGGRRPAPDVGVPGSARPSSAPTATGADPASVAFEAVSAGTGAAESTP